MKSETINFVITGAFVTKHARELWGEGDGPGALRFLGHVMGLPEDAKHAILEGRKKLSGTTEGRGVYLEDDNATTDKHGRKLLTMIQYMVNEKAKLKKAEERANDTITAKSRDTVVLGSPWGKIDVPRVLTKLGHDGLNQLALESWDEFKERFPEIVAKTMKKRQEEWDNSEISRRIDAMGERAFGLGAGIMATLDPRLQGAAQALFNPETGVPKPDKELAGINGWISPEGKLYSCNYMGHVNLAHRLDKTEAVLEKSWVKLQSCNDPMAPFERPGDHDFIHIPDRGVTQAQLNTMNRWCTKHGRPMPTNIEVR